MFEKSLADLIQGLRANKRNEADYLQRSLGEIQAELQQSDMQIKSNAIDKLNYLHMLGYDTNWANFNAVEVMASSRFDQKRIGYLAASLSFHQETDVLMLTTNLIRKDLASAKVLEVGVALDGLAQIATPELAMDLFDDVIAVLSHSRPYIRKKALACLYKLVLKYSEGLHALAPLLKERLDDPDPSVVSSAVSVICELARTNPRNYLPLAPKLYNLLNSSNNNWMLIKIVKLFALLTPIEPRLAKKLHGPLSQLICTTSAMSLLYECIYTAVIGDVISVPIPVADSLGRDMDFGELCARKLELFYDSQDHNLRYVGLLTLANLQAKRSDVVENQYDTVLGCLDDPDMSIRMRAINVLSGMTTRRTLAKTVKTLMSQLLLSNTVALKPQKGSAGTANEGDSNSWMLSSETAAGTTSLFNAQGSFISQRKRPEATSRGREPDPADNPEYRQLVVETIIDICSRQSYTNLSNFEWYVATLVDLVYVAGVDVGELLSERIRDVTVRVRQVREYSLNMMRRLLVDVQLVDNLTKDSPRARVLAMAAYIVGEYCSLQPANIDDVHMLLPFGLSKLDDEQQTLFVMAAMKAYTNWLREMSREWNSSDTWDSVRAANAFAMERVTEIYLTSTSTENSNGEVLLAALPLQVSSCVRRLIEIIEMVSVATSNPSDDAPQICLDLHDIFTANELNPVSAAAQDKVPIPDGLDLDAAIGETAIPDTSHIVFPPKPVVLDQQHQYHPNRQNGAFYLGSSSSNRNEELPDVDDIPVVRLDLEDSSTKDKKKKKKSKKSKKRNAVARVRTPSPPPVAVDIADDEDMPPGGNQ